MKVGIDARPLISEHTSGIGNYLINILKFCNNSQDVQYILYANEPLIYHREIVDRFEKRIIPGKIGTIWLCYKLKKQLYHDCIDVFWGTQHMLPLNTKGIHLVLTVHDLALLINPNWGSTQNAIMQNIFCRRSCKKANVVIADSASTADDVSRIIGKNIGDIKTILLGGDDVNKIPQNDFEKIGNKWNISCKEYFLFVGTLEPRKNIIGIIEAFNTYCSNEEGEEKLVLAGGYGWKYRPILEDIKKSPYKDRIIITGYVSEIEKQILYSNAIAFVFPSYYEGFGLPVLEAMSYGIPVICTETSSLPEVGGEYAYYVKTPTDTMAIYQAMKAIRQLDDFQRTALSTNEQKWYKRFSWERCAMETIKVIKTQQVVIRCE